MLKQKILDEAEESKLTIETLAAGLAHELGNPIDAVRRYVNLALYESMADPLTKEYLLQAKKGISRMVNVLHDLLIYTKQTQNEPGKRVEVHALMEKCLQEFSGDLMMEGISVQRIFSESGPLYFEDRGGLLIILRNLYRNAFYAMKNRRHGTLTLATWQQNGSVGIAVQDTGGGVPEAIKARIFEPFFSTKNREEGSGIGLALSRELVARSGGSLSVENVEEPVRGARFTLVLPRMSTADLKNEPALHQMVLG